MIFFNIIILIKVDNINKINKSQIQTELAFEVLIINNPHQSRNSLVDHAVPSDTFLYHMYYWKLY